MIAREPALPGGLLNVPGGDCTADWTNSTIVRVASADRGRMVTTDVRATLQFLEQFLIQFQELDDEFLSTPIEQTPRRLPSEIFVSNANCVD